MKPEAESYADENPEVLQPNLQAFLLACLNMNCDVDNQSFFHRRGRLHDTVCVKACH